MYNFKLVAGLGACASVSEVVGQDPVGDSASTKIPVSIVPDAGNVAVELMPVPPLVVGRRPLTCEVRSIWVAAKMHSSPSITTNSASFECSVFIKPQYLYQEIMENPPTIAAFMVIEFPTMV